MGKFSNYHQYVREQARNFRNEYINELLDEIHEGSTDAYEFIQDSKLHEWCDNDFIYVGLLDSAEILDQSDYVETDFGLWDGQEPRDAIETQAFYTYRRDLTVYCPVGQHSTGSVEYIKECERIAKDEYIQASRNYSTPEEYLKENV